MSDNWDLTKLFKNEDEFLKELERLKGFVKVSASYKGTLHNEEKLKEYLDIQRDLNESLTKLYVFASMRSDLNKKDVNNNSDLTKCQLLLNDLQAATSFESPEIIALGKDKVFDFIRRNPKYKDYDFNFTKLFRSQEHILDGDKERLISCFNPLLSQGASLYSMLSVGDFTSKEVTLSTGEKLVVTQGNWRNAVANSKDPEDRRKIFEAIFSYYEERKNAYGEIYNTVLQEELAYMKARNYSSILESHLFNNNIPTSVFTNLVETTSSHTAPLIKYWELRRKYLGLSKHRSYDRFIQLAHSDKKYPYEDAKEIFYKSISDFPSDFQAKAHEVTKEGYVDVYEKEGKRSGAYSTGGSGIHPYILLNFDNALDDVFTLAHESGHSIHTLYSMENQPVLKQDYTIFVAEIASTFNEHNLLDYLIRSGNLSKEEKIMMLQKSIDDICSTFYRQTLFAQFEYILSKKAEAGEPINYDVCNKTMIELYKTYYGIDITEEKVKEYVWAYIPHIFYTPFYVYQYATSFTASMQLYANVKNKKPQAFEKYLSLLKSGGSEFPIDQVKKAGVDLTTNEPFLAVINRMSELVDELEKALKE